MSDDFRAPQARMRSSWSETKLVMRGPLTDRKIAQYEKRGWYSAEFKAARRERMMQRQSVKRDGNWLRMEDGRTVYSPR